MDVHKRFAVMVPGGRNKLLLSKSLVHKISMCKVNEGFVNRSTAPEA